MDFEKECFVAYCSYDDATLKNEFVRLVAIKMEEGKTQLEAVKEVRKAVSTYFSYRANQQEKETYSEMRRKRCFNAVITNDEKSEQFIASIYGLSCSETVTYARSYAFYTGAKSFGPSSNFEVAGRKYIAASKKRQSATPENEETFIKIAHKISYAGFKQLKSFFDRIKISDEYFSKMSKYLKENKPEIYKTLMTNITTANLMLNCEPDDVAKQLELINSIRTKIIYNTNYTILDFYKDTDGLSTSRFYALYSLHFNVNNDSEHKSIARFLKKNDEDDNVYSSSTMVSKAYKAEDGTITYKTVDPEQAEFVFNYIKSHGWPCNMYTFSTGLDLILDRPEFFEPNGPKKA